MTALTWVQPDDNPNFRIQAVQELDGLDSYYMCSDTETNWRPGDHSSEEVILARMAELEETWDAQEYARKRKVEYNALNQFELMTDDAENSTTTHADAIAAVKTKWPKDNSGPVE
jgi:hypothetical protein